MCDKEFWHVLLKGAVEGCCCKVLLQSAVAGCRGNWISFLLFGAYAARLGFWIGAYAAYTGPTA